MLYILYYIFLILTLLKSFVDSFVVEWLNGFVDCREQQSRDLDDYNVMTFVAFCLYSPLWLAGHYDDLQRLCFTHSWQAVLTLRERCFKCCLKDWSAVKLINLKLHLTFACRQHLRDVWHFAFFCFNFLKVSRCSTSSKLSVRSTIFPNLPCRLLLQSWFFMSCQR